MEAKTYKWEGAGTPLPDGHRIFESHDHPDGARWAIVDDSGDTPDQSEDGVLWLDPTRCLSVTHSFYAIPVTAEDGSKFSVPTDPPTLFYLSRMMRWTVEDPANGRFYNVR